MKSIFTTILVLSILFAKAQESQDVELLKLASGKFTVYKAVESGSNFKFETAKLIDIALEPSIPL